MKSIMHNDEYCYVCAVNLGTESHHCLHGTANRKQADKYGLIVKLCPECHRGTHGVHGREGAPLDRILKRQAQKMFEQEYPDLSFKDIFGKNYL